MKNFKLFVIVLTAAVVLTFSSCDKAGGTIEVTNGLTTPNVVTVLEGADVDIIGALDKTGKALNAGETTTYTFDKDGSYTVIAAMPLGFVKVVLLVAGSTEKVTVK